MDSRHNGRMEHHPWQERARNAGLTQKRLALLLGFAEFTVSRQLRGHFEGGVPKHVQAFIMAWERLPPDARQALVEWAEGAKPPA